jgi:hypothetical protein
MPPKKEKALSAQSKRANVSKRPGDSSDSRTAKEKELDQLADEAAERAEKTEQRYDAEHDIFTK